MRYPTVHAAAVVRRRATGADVPVLRELFADAHVEFAVLPPDTRFVLVDMRFRAQRRQRLRQHPRAVQQIVCSDGRAVGQLVLDDRGDHVRVLDLSVGLGRRREGIASAALRDVCRAHARVRVDVRAGDVAARALYAGVGFEVTAEHRDVLTLEFTRE